MNKAHINDEYKINNDGQFNYFRNNRYQSHIYTPRTCQILNLGESSPVLLQVLGALYFGFAILNWIARDAIIGGIYSRSVAIGNFAYFFMGGPALFKFVLHHPNRAEIWGCTVLYLLLAAVSCDTRTCILHNITDE